MPKISKENAPNVEDFGLGRQISAVRSTNTPSTSSRSGRDIPSPRCSRGSPATAARARTGWYLFAGKITVTYADRVEVFQAGDAFLMSPGHIPAAESGSEFVHFSPTDQLNLVRAHMTAAARAMQGASVAP